MPNLGKIYIVDDTPTNLQVLADYLIELGFEVFVAMDGEQAIEQVTQSCPDLILLDVMMPGIDGFETCRRLKTVDATKDIPVIFMTALSETVDKVKGFLAGAVDYVTKPIQQEEVLARITTHLALRQLQKDLQEKNTALQRAEENYRGVFENAVVGIFQTTLSGQFLSANSMLAHILGYSSPKNLLESCRYIESEIYVETGRRREFQDMLFRDNVVSNFESKIRKKNGDEIWISENVRGIYDSSNSLVSYEGFVVDINDRKQAEEQNARLRAHNHYLQEEVDAGQNYGEVVVGSESLRKVLSLIDHVSPTDSTVLIQGETGTGKEVLARAIHEKSHRKQRPMVKVNCGAISPGLVESELFGHEKGAFTGAIAKRVGRFELADGGTLFLDEIGELSAETQVKLLRVLQEQEFERVGSSQVVRVDVRLIAATNRNLQEAVKGGTFRADLFYRLNIFPLQVPPLRERQDDIPLLAGHFLKKLARRLGKDLDRFSGESVARLIDYSWPGNVRELMNVVERASILATSSVVEIDDVLDPLMEAPVEIEPPGPVGVEHRTLRDLERAHIIQILESTRGVLEGDNGAATILGLNPSTLRFRMQKLGIKRPVIPT